MYRQIQARIAVSDVAQEVWISVLRRMESFDPSYSDSRVQRMVALIAKRKALRAGRRHRQARRSVELERPAHLSELAAGTPSPSTVASQSELSEQLLQKLSDEERKILRLYEEGQTVDQIMSAMNLSRASVYRRINRITRCIVLEAPEE